MKPYISYQGVLTAGDTTIFTVPSLKMYAVSALRVNNPLAYDFTLKIYQFSTNTTISIYDLALSAGDTVTDNYIYYLDVNDQLILNSSIPNTSYIISVLTY